MRSQRAVLALLSAISIIVLLLVFIKWRSRNGANADQSRLSIASDEKSPRSSEKRTRTRVAESISQAASALLEEGKADTTYRTLAHDEIAFYGRLIDQSGKGLPNGKVSFTVDSSFGIQANYRNGTTQTDRDGYFTIAGYRGQRLSIRPEIIGYALASTNAGGIYSHFWATGERHQFDPKRPNIIQMWKLRGAEELIKVSKSFKVHSTNGPVLIDLTTGSLVSEGGDLTICINRPDGTISPQRKANWSLTVSAIEGGVQQIDPMLAQITFEAPTNGYQKQIVFQRNGDDPNWSTQVDASFLLASRKNEVFSKVALSFMLNEDSSRPCWIGISATLNPNGSRNWEEDAIKIKRIEGK